MTTMRRYVLSSLGIALLIGTVYGRAVLQNDFVTWDDGLLITENPIIQDISWENVKAAFTTYDPELYIPLTFLTYQMDYAVWGMRPFGFHLTNLILHTGNAILVFWLMTLLLKNFQRTSNNQITNNIITRTPGNVWIALAVALLWSLHPLNTEAVAWASARKDLLSGFFFLLSVCGYLQWRARVTLRCEPSEPRRALLCHGSWRAGVGPPPPPTTGR